jgi:hypothetical protein
MEGGGVTYEDPSEALTSSSSVVSDASKKKKKPKNKGPPINSIPDELLERNARFEIQHMMNFRPDDDKSVSGSVSGSSSVVSGISAKHVLNQQMHKDEKKEKKQGTKPKEKGEKNQSPPVERKHTPGVLNMPGDLPLSHGSHSTGHAHEHMIGNEHVPAGTPSPDHVYHGDHIIHTFAGNHSDGTDGIIVVHAHHDVSTAKRMNSPEAKYKVVPGRSSSPGYYGNESQKGKEDRFVGGYWNDNCDVQYEKTATLRSTTGGNVAVKVEPRPELFLDEAEKEKKRKKKKKAAEEKARSMSPDEKPAGPKRVYLTQDEIARQTIIRAREVVSTNTKFRTRELSSVEAGLFRSPFAMPLVTEKMRREADLPY